MLVTVRGRWFLLFATLATTAGLLTERILLSQLGFASLLWFAAEWILFRYRVDVVIRNTVATRRISFHGVPVSTLWVDRPFDVSVRVSLPGAMGLVHGEFSERLPTAAKIDDCKATNEVTWGRAQEVELQFVLRPNRMGVVQWEGIRTRISDLQGFFYARRCLRLRGTNLVMAAPFDAGSVQPITKRHNQLRPPGTHRFMRPGSSSELLEIRDYQPGDPPRSIAWKISARRGTLMSKQFENEVPVRCTLLIDTTRSIRLGWPNPTPLDSVSRLAAAVVDACVENRDPVGLCLIDDHTVEISQPASNRKTAIRLRKRIAEIPLRPMPPVNCPAKDLELSAWALVHDIYPNHELTSSAFVAGLFPVRPRQRRRLRRQWQLAFFLSAFYDLDAMGPSDLCADDELRSSYLQRLLADHQVPYPGPVYDSKGKYLLKDASKVETLSRTLNRVVHRSVDNELFVIMADLVELGAHELQPLVQAIRVARARHHRVIVVCAWPPGIHPPKNNEPSLLTRFAKGIVKQQLTATVGRHVRVKALRQLRQELTRFRVPVVAANDLVATQLILTQIDLIRGGRVITR